MIQVKRTGRKRFANYEFHILWLPFLILFFIFTILPILSSVVLSFTDFDAVSSPRFIGLDNYFRMFTGDEVLPVALKNTVMFAIFIGPFGFALSFFLAWIINEFGKTARSILSFLFYSPALVGNVFYIWQIAFSGDAYGYINSFLMSFGIVTEPIQWFRNESYVFPLIVIIQLWLSMGVSFLANIAGLQNVDDELYEAGAIDGIKTRWHELWYITLPSMKSILLFGIVMQIQAAFSVGAIPMALAGYPSVNHAVDTILSHLQDVGTERFEMGYASAISVLLFVLIIVTKKLLTKFVNFMGR
ncbi:MAG: sugar ABC transporter permease [Clostridia bacterium]|nr:sugar ABC transporter permease [Clostridia bacterium]